MLMLSVFVQNIVDMIVDYALWRGALGFSVLRIWPIFDSVFRFSLVIIAGLRFWCLVRFAGFLQFSFRFSVFVKNDGRFFGFFCPIHFTVFPILPRKSLTPCSHAKTVIPRATYS